MVSATLFRAKYMCVCILIYVPAAGGGAGLLTGSAFRGGFTGLGMSSSAETTQDIEG